MSSSTPSNDATEGGSQPTSSGKPTKLILALLAIIALIVAARYFNAQELLKQAIDGIEGLGFWGPLIFIALYILATVFFVPGSILTLGAGAVFGVVWGSIWVSIASTIGATCAFIVGRYFAREWVAQKIEGNATFASIDRAVAKEGWKIVGLTRLSPAFPFNLLNYALGLTKVSLPHYILASWIGMMPGTVMYVYLGSIAKAGAEASEKSTAQWILYAVGLVATIVVTLIITRIAYRALAARTGVDNVPSEKPA